MTRPSFETWLTKTECYAIIDRALFIAVPNTFVAEMLEQRMFTLIINTAYQVLGYDASVEFVIAVEESEEIPEQ